MQQRSPFKSRGETASKAAVIAQLRVENDELRRKLQGGANLQLQVADLEHRFNSLLAEKTQLDEEANARERRRQDATRELEKELKALQDALTAAEDDMAAIRAETQTAQVRAGENRVEIERLQREVENQTADNDALQQARANVATDIGLVQDRLKRTNDDNGRLARLNEELAVQQTQAEERLRARELEASALARQLTEARLELAAAKRQATEAETELAAARETEQLRDAEVLRQTGIGERLLVEEADLSRQAEAVQQRLTEATRRLDQTLSIINDKDIEIKSIQGHIAVAEEESIQGREELRRLQRENELLQATLSKCRGEAESLKRLSEADQLDLERLAEEKRRLEEEALARNIEARNVKTELEKLQQKQGEIRELRTGVTEELNALKEHANVLESQNVTLHRELDRFADTNEAVRQELDRKLHVDYLKSKNEAEYQASIAKVRTSQSPSRSPSRSPLRPPTK